MLAHRVRGHALNGPHQVRHGGAGQRHAPGPAGVRALPPGLGGLAHVREDLARRGIQHDERLMQDWRRAVAQSSVGQIGQGELEPPTGGLQLGDEDRGPPPRGGGYAHDGGRGQAHGALGADPFDELMSLVDHQDPVLGQYSGVSRRGDAEHGVVGHDDVGLGCGGAGELGEALLAQRAGRPQALGPGHRHLRPGAVGDARDQVVAVAGGGLLGPLAQPDDLLPG